MLKVSNLVKSTIKKQYIVAPTKECSLSQYPGEFCGFLFDNLSFDCGLYKLIFNVDVGVWKLLGIDAETKEYLFINEYFQGKYWKFFINKPRKVTLHLILSDYKLHKVINVETSEIKKLKFDESIIEQNFYTFHNGQVYICLDDKNLSLTSKLSLKKNCELLNIKIGEGNFISREDFKKIIINFAIRGSSRYICFLNPGKLCPCVDFENVFSRLSIPELSTKSSAEIEKKMSTDIIIWSRCSEKISITNDITWKTPFLNLSATDLATLLNGECFSLSLSFCQKLYELFNENKSLKFNEIINLDGDKRLILVANPALFVNKDSDVRFKQESSMLNYLAPINWTNVLERVFIYFFVTDNAEESLKSILSQSYQNIVLNIVDKNQLLLNNPLLKRNKKNLSTIKYFTDEKCLKDDLSSKKGFIMFVKDEIFEHNRIEKQLKEMINSPKILITSFLNDDVKTDFRYSLYSSACLVWNTENIPSTDLEYLRFVQTIFNDTFNNIEKNFKKRDFYSILPEKLIL